jgi:predicted nucleotidyltransferase
MTSHDIKTLLQPILEKYRDKIVSAYLFGTGASGETHPRSDIDIALLFSETTGSYFDLKLSLYADFCRVLKRDDIDVLVLNSADNLILLDQVIRRGIVLFDRDKDLREEFEHRILHRAIDFKDQRFANMGI